LVVILGKTCARRAVVERGGRTPLEGRSAVWVAVMVAPLGRPTV
jgi:hypothetical protein